MLDGCAELYIFQGETLTALRNADEILELYLKLFRWYVNHHFLIVMGDNVHPHWVYQVDEYFDWGYSGKRMASRYPDLIPNSSGMLCSHAPSKNTFRAMKCLGGETGFIVPRHKEFRERY
ncbi:hypothetical protein TNCV_2400581 [Trichonephila clavipes]|nr:hypothetical protein TNCV_2400581 [Trichonephila clavipes]